MYKQDIEQNTYKCGVWPSDQAKDYDIDGILIKVNSPDTIIEVKWRNDISIDNIKKAESNLSRLGAKRRLLFVQDKKTFNLTE